MSHAEEIPVPNFDSPIIADLESGQYLKPEFHSTLKNEVQTKIQEFSQWFNSTARLYLLKCDPAESEMYIYLLLDLKKKLKFAISELNKSVSNHEHSFTCNCGESVDIEPFNDVWTTLQDHPHFEENYSSVMEKGDLSCEQIVENGESSMTSSTIEDLSEESNQELQEEASGEAVAASKPQGTGINDFKFNFVITYDERIESALYNQAWMQAIHKIDGSDEYTFQRCGVNKGVCLLCPCSLISKGKVSLYVVKNHIAGQRHLKSAATAACTSALKEYHEFWRSQECNIQAHQIHFVPDIPNVLRCQLCHEAVPYNNIIKHIKDTKHKSKVLKLLNSPEGKSNEYFNLDMQVGVYDVVVKKEEKPKEDAPPMPKCVFIKFTILPNAINLPGRYKDHLQYFVKNDEIVRCKVCKIGFFNSTELIKNHILNPQHKQLAALSLPKYTFFCEICNMHFKDEARWYEHFTKGPNRHDKMAESRKQKVAEWECKTCLVVIFGDELSLTRHISARTRGKAKEVRLPFPVKKFFKSKAFIEEEARRVRLEAGQVLECQEKMIDCCEDLQKALSVIYPNCRAYPFGSRISGLGNNQSDLDVFMDTGGMYLGVRLQDSQSQEQFVKKASKVLKSSKDNFSSVVPIPTARTPIVKLHHNYTNLDCDISFRHGLGVENTKFIRFCIDLQPITQPFILLLKKWSGFCKLNEHIMNYGLALMAIFYLQTRRYLLSVKTVRNFNPTQSVIIDGWETINYTVPIDRMKEFVEPCTSSVKDLLRDFFYYFAKFDYANDVVCPLLGNTIPKLLFNEKPNGESLPIEMKSYVQRIQTENGEQFRGLSPFCIQDPFDLSHNLTKACPSSIITKLKTLCTLTYEFLDTIE